MPDSLRVHLIERDAAAPDAQKIYDALLAARGVVPNMFKALAHRPEIAQGVAGFLKPLLSDGALPGFYKELVAVRVSQLQDSAYAVRAHKTEGAINFTASHNPPEYNGIKFSTPDGAPALPDVTRQIEAEIAALPADLPAPGPTRVGMEETEIRHAYLKRIREMSERMTRARDCASPSVKRRPITGRAPRIGKYEAVALIPSTRSGRPGLPSTSSAGS